jgi:aspartyl-tRNA(Asn)/glutamyl-tRNA(Gln) amidotransferase subunit C
LPIDTEQVRRIASLAELDLDPETVESLRRDLQAILAYVALLDGIHVEDVEPTSHPPRASTPLRNDRVTPSLDREEALANAPDAKDGQFRVPRVLDE